MKYNSKTTAIPEIIPVVLICTAGIISAGRIHLYLALLLHRDYFRRSNASLSCSFAPQGLFPPAGCIPSFLFCPTGIISAGRMHLYLPLLLHRDYFDRPDSSLSSSFAPQGLFRRSDTSLSSSFAPQGLFPPAGFIPSLLFSSTEIISAGRMHLYLALLPHRDYFHRPDASLSCSFVPQGLFLPAECISILLFSSTGIISAGRIHLYLALFFHRDYFCRPDASLSSSFASQGLFPPIVFIPSLLFSSTGIISAGRMHPQLALFFHRDYFGQPNASLIRVPVKYQRPNFYYTGNTRMASADTLCKKLPQDRQKQSVLSLSILYFCRYGDILFW